MDKKVAAFLLVVDATYDAIKEAGQSGIPAGHLYAAMCGHINLENFNLIIGPLKEAGKIKESGHLLTAV